jgi:hypothetical protein
MSVILEITKAVVDGEFGELKLTFTNSSAGPVTGLKLSVKDNGPVSPNALGSLVYLPAEADGGYLIPGSVAQGAQVSRLFAIKPVDAEAGKTFAAVGSATWSGGSESANAQVFVEARPEVYAAIGAGERMRQVLLGAYENFKAAGRAVHQETALPDTKGEPASYALQPTTFQWALGLIEQGTKAFKDQKKQTGNVP